MANSTAFRSPEQITPNHFFWVPEKTTDLTAVERGYLQERLKALSAYMETFSNELDKAENWMDVPSGYAKSLTINYMITGNSEWSRLLEIREKIKAILNPKIDEN